MNNVHIYYQNVRGLNTKVNEFYAASTLAKFDVYALAETWLTSNVTSSELFNEKYTVIRHDHVLSRGGGVLLLPVKSNYKIVPLDLSLFHSTVPSVDVVGANITFSSASIYVFFVYIPPALNTDTPIINFLSASNYLK